MASRSDHEEEARLKAIEALQLDGQLEGRFVGIVSRAARRFNTAYAALTVVGRDKVNALSNAREVTEISDISTALGVAPHRVSDEVDFSKLRYGKLCILADADVDGFHIQVLLLTLFYRHFPQLIDRGHVYVARPKRPAKKLNAMDEAELEQLRDRLAA